VQVHLDALGWLHVLAGWIGLVSGAALMLLAAGTSGVAVDVSAAPRVSAVMWFLLAGSVALLVGAAAMMATGVGLLARRRGARRGALLLAVPNLCALPFGTALAAYTLWALLNDDAREAFGRPLRGGALER
jgi:hypothetical protein